MEGRERILNDLRKNLGIKDKPIQEPSIKVMERYKINFRKEGRPDSVVINTCSSFAEAEESVQKSLKWYGKIISIEKMIKK